MKLLKIMNKFQDNQLWILMAKAMKALQIVFKLRFCKNYFLVNLKALIDKIMKL